MTFQNAYFEDGMVTTLADSLNQICQQDSCKNAVSEYLEACEDIGDVGIYTYIVIM